MSFFYVVHCNPPSLFRQAHPHIPTGACISIEEIRKHKLEPGTEDNEDTDNDGDRDNRVDLRDLKRHDVKID